jgi:hypothetical protein
MFRRFLAQSALVGAFVMLAASAQAAVLPVDGVKVQVPGHTAVTFETFDDTPGSPEFFVGLTFLPTSFSDATIFLSEAASQGGGVSDALSIMVDSAGTGINIFFFSDPLQIPAPDIATRQFTIAETGQWQDVSSYFGQPAGFAQVISDLDATTPVPEPAAWAMIMLGLACVGAVARRRRAHGARDMGEAAN